MEKVKKIKKAIFFCYKKLVFSCNVLNVTVAQIWTHNIYMQPCWISRLSIYIPRNDFVLLWINAPSLCLLCKHHRVNEAGARSLTPNGHTCCTLLTADVCQKTGNDMCIYLSLLREQLWEVSILPATDRSQSTPCLQKEGGFYVGKQSLLPKMKNLNDKDLKK